MPGLLVNPILFLTFALFVGFAFFWPHDPPAVFHALQTIVFTFIVWPLSDFLSLDEGTFGCSLDQDTPRVVDTS